MNIHLRIFQRTVQVVTAITLGASTLHAENPPVNEFFERDGALDVFGSELVEKTEVTYQHFPARLTKKIDLTSKAAPLAPPPLAVAPQSPAPLAATPAQPAELKTNQDVLREYGDPKVDAPVLAQDNAPKPFKAMMAAFQVGDEQLAYQYARQWVRYMSDVKERTTLVVDAARAARAAEKVASGDSAQAQQIRNLIAAENARLPEGPEGDRAREILAQARAAESGVNPLASIQKGKPLTPEQQELMARREIRAKLTGKIPVDKEGRVDLYVFFDPKSEDAQKVVWLTNQLQSLALRNKFINIAAFTNTEFSKAELEAYSRVLKLKVPLLIGSGLSQQLEISKFPSLALVSPASGVVVKEGVEKPFFYYDELISIMTGRKG